MIKLLLAFCIGLFISGCGYAPIAHYSQKALGNSVYIDLKINAANTENSVALRDLLNKVVVMRFQKELKNKEEADSVIYVEMTNIQDQSIATNSDGFTTFYRVNLTLSFKYSNRTHKETQFSNSAYYDYAVSLEDPAVTYENRLDAIEQATIQCVDKFLSQVAYQGK